MQTLFTLLGFIVAGLYLIVSMCYLVVFMSEESKWRVPVRSLAVVSILVHLFYLLLIVIQHHRLPLASVFEALTFMVFVLAVAYAFIQYTSHEPETGLFVYPVIFILQIIAAFNLSIVETFNPILSSPYFALHTVPSILGYAAFLISLKYSTMYLMMHKQIKSRKFGMIYEKLPSLDGLDRLNKKAVITGFILLTAGILAGTLWAGTAWESQPANNPKVFASFIVWIIYFTSILLRFFRGWQGKRVAYLSVFGGIVLLLSFFVI